MNKFEEYTDGKKYKTKLDMIADCFTHFGEITIRDLVIAPFYCNCGYGMIRNLRKYRGFEFTKEDLIKDGKKVCEVYKLA